MDVKTLINVIEDFIKVIYLLSWKKYILVYQFQMFYYSKNSIYKHLHNLLY